jgi:hypothetical protein
VSVGLLRSSAVPDLKAHAAAAAALSSLLLQDLQESISLLASMPPDALVAPKPADSTSLLPSFLLPVPCSICKSCCLVYAAADDAVLVLLPQDLQQSLSLLGSMPPDALVAPNPADSSAVLLVSSSSYQPFPQ